jgi:hypothetical protein
LLAPALLASRIANAEIPTSSVAGPTIELPAPDAKEPKLALPRETAIDTPLGDGPVLRGSAFGGYGELTLNAPKGSAAVLDLRRVVLFFGHNFNDHFRFYSELEVEHAVASSGDKGEFEVEQAYLDALIDRRINLRGGLVLMPAGIINIFHEPPSFNGVDRPDVDTYVIPTTWREPAIGIFGEIAEGLRYQAFLVNGFNANGFTADSAIREGHQEAQFARAGDFGGIVRLDYEPILGANVGMSGYLATSGNSLRATVGRVPVGLIDADLKVKRGALTLRAEIAFLFIGDAAALDQALANGSPDQMAQGPVASQSRGAYVELGYDLLNIIVPDTEQALVLFGRWDYADTQAQVPDGFTKRPELRRQTGTVGLVYRPIPEIGLKADLRHHVYGAGPAVDEFASAITWMF